MQGAVRSSIDASAQDTVQSSRLPACRVPPRSLWLNSSNVDIYLPLYIPPIPASSVMSFNEEKINFHRQQFDGSLGKREMMMMMLMVAMIMMMTAAPHRVDEDLDSVPTLSNDRPVGIPRRKG